MLDYIVVNTTKDGQDCINYLRECDIGRANFLVLEKANQQRPAMERSQTLQIPSGSRRVIDLISPSDPSLLPAFYLALRDTLVAKDLDAAVAMAYQGGKAMWRVVTTDGNLIDISGSMSGGGKSVRSGGMRLSGEGTARVAATSTDEVSHRHLYKYDNAFPIILHMTVTILPLCVTSLPAGDSSASECLGGKSGTVRDRTSYMQTQ